MACAIKNLEEKDPRFLEIKSWYSDPEIPWYKIATDINAYRREKDVASDWYPSPGDKDAFMSFVSNYRKVSKKLSDRDKRRRKNNIITREAVEIYKDMLKLGYTKAQMDARIDIIKNGFSSLVNGVLKKAEDDGRKLSINKIIRAYGGYAKMMDMIFKRLSNASAEEEYQNLIKITRGAPKTEEAEKKMRDKAEYIAAEKRKIAENRDRFASLATRRISDVYGLVIERGNEIEMNLREYDEEIDGQDARDNDKGTKGDRYVDVRTKKLMSTLSADVRVFLSQIPMTDNAGHPLRDDLGQIKFIDSRQIAYILPGVLRFSTPKDMMADLTAAADRYPYIRHLVNRLSGKYRESDKDYQSAIYTDFKRVAETYAFIKNGRGGYKADKANTKAHGNSLMRAAGINMQGPKLDEDWSAYDGGGLVSEDIDRIYEEINDILGGISEKLGFVNTMRGGYDKRAVYRKDNTRTGYKDLTDYSIYAKENGGVEAIRKFLKDEPDTIGWLVKAVRGLGMDVTEKQMESAVLSPVNRKTGRILNFSNENDKSGGNRLTAIIDNILSAYGEFAKRDDTGKLVYKSSQDVFNTINREFVALNSALAVSFFDELEPRVLSGDSTLSTWVYPSLLHETMDDLNNEAQLSTQEYNSFLEENYLKYDDMTLKGKPTGWLKRLYNGASFSEDGGDESLSGPFKLLTLTEFNHVDYNKLSESQKVAAQITMYAQQNRAIEYPIESDYENAWNFITNAGSGANYTYANMQSEIQKLQLEEIDRASAQSETKLNRKEKGQIRSRVRQEYMDSNIFFERPDGTLHTEWKVVQDVTDEVLIEIDRIRKLRAEIAADPKGLSGPRMKVFDEQGLKFQIFPEFNNDNVFENFEKIEDDIIARDFIAKKVAAQLQNVIKEDIKVLNRTGALSNPTLRLLTVGGGQMSFYSKDGKYESLSSGARSYLENFFLDYFSGRLQMVKLTNGGLANFNGLLDYEKRNMMSHANRRAYYSEATWNGERVGRENQRAIYLVDEKSDSSILGDIDEMLGQLEEDGLLSSEQRSRMASAYKNITVTDGQAFRTYESYRMTQIGLAKWTPEREAVYQYLVNNKGDISNEELSKELQTIYNPNEKPVYTGWTVVNNRKVPVLHKYSETVLFPVKVMEKLMDNIPAQLRAMAEAAEKLNEKEPFDIFLFQSCVKVGCHSAVDPFGYIEEEYVDENGKTKKRRVLDENKHPIRKNNTAEEMRDSILNAVSASPWSIHVLPMKYYGEAAATPAHGTDEEIAISSQAEKEAWGNVGIGSNEKVRAGGQEMDAVVARETYDDINAVSAAAAYKELQELFDDPEELRQILKEELATASYASPELEFAISGKKVPFFYPSISRSAEQLFLSIIRKRMTRQGTKGANMLQVTSLGYDTDPFGVGFDVPEKHKLNVVFEGTGRNKHIKYVECYLPIHDSRLEQFADEHGVITPEQLDDLVERNIIPEEALRFVAYRTPSDDIHSLVPLRIKGFISKTQGSNIIVPKEIMKMTGHDFDGDKLRCHFQDFHSVDVIDEKKLQEDYYTAIKNQDSEIAKFVLDKIENADTQKYSFEFFRDRMLSRDNPNRNDYIIKGSKFQMYEYDYSKKAFENSQKARDNARVQLLFGRLTSPEGTRLMLIPGGSHDIDKYGAVFQIVRTAYDSADVAGRLAENGVDMSSVKKTFRDLLTKDNKELSRLLDIVNGNTTPYTFGHSIDAYNYIMGGANMISVYALYASAAQLMQRANLRYNQPSIQKTDKDGKKHRIKLNVGFFKHSFGELYPIRNYNGGLNSLTMSEGVNSAVDNGKNPRLGYLNQVPELAEITNFLEATGMPALNVHLVLNQPVVVELVNRMRNGGGFTNNAEKMLDELTNKKKAYLEYRGARKASELVYNLGEDSYIEMMPRHYSELENTKDGDFIARQIALLRTLQLIYKDAELLSAFIKVTRPEASTAGLATTIAGTISITHELNRVRAIAEKELSENDEDKPGILGMLPILAKREVYDDDSVADIYTQTEDSPLRQVTSLQTLMQDGSYERLAKYFPLAKKKYRELVEAIASKLVSNNMRLPEGDIRQFANEMILWNLLKNPNFAGDIEAERENLLGAKKDGGMPRKLDDLKRRIQREKKLFDKGEPVRDAAARELIGNTFINKLFVDRDIIATELPRISFRPGGVSMDELAQTITYDWAQMSVSSDPEIRQFAVDLFKYNTYQSGFGYGMYEFAHFAPYTVLEQVPGYLDALNGIRDSFVFSSDNEDTNNFIHQLYMNHWADARLVPQIPESQVPNEFREELGLSMLTAKQNAGLDFQAKLIRERPYITIVRSDGTLDFRRVNKSADNKYTFTKAQKLAKRNKYMQVTVNYNPYKSPTEITPLQLGDDSYWNSEYVLMLKNSEAANLEDTENQQITDEEADNYTDELLAAEGLKESKAVKAHDERVERRSTSIDDFLDQVAAMNEHNEKILQEEKGSVPEEIAGAMDVIDAIDGNVGQEQDDIDYDSLFESAEPDPIESMGDDRRMFSIGRIEVDENGNERVVRSKVRVTPNSVREARKQRAFYELNQRLRKILREKGVAVGVLNDIEARLNLNGVTDFDTAVVTAEGLKELIRISEGYYGEQALPEEFAHTAIEMLGHDDVLVNRLLNALRNDEEAMREAFGSDEMYDEYNRAYNGNEDKMVLEAAGKLVAKNLLLQQEIESRGVRSLIHRIIDKIKEFFRSIGRKRIDDAILDANHISAQLARDILSGRIVDGMSIDRISSSERFYNVQKDLSNRNGLLDRILKQETERLALLKRRTARDKNSKDKNAKPSASQIATENQVALLEKGIRSHKIESTLVEYLNNALSFLRNTEADLQKYVEAGYKINSVCRKLNTIRDVLFSYANVIQILNEGNRAGEFTMSPELEKILKDVKLEMDSFQQEYEFVGMNYFERMLKNIYGEHGITHTVGPNKGKVLTIEEMARKADRDVNVMNRMLSSLADTGDYVLAAFDFYTRQAKIDARRRTAGIQPKLNAAFEKLVKETGSRDQTFMFKYETVAGGKRRRTGKYITAEEAERLPYESQREFYKTVMEIKKQVDDCLPPGVVRDNLQIVALRKYGFDRIKDATGVGGKWQAFVENVKNSVLDMSDNINYEEDRVIKDFEGNKVDMLPIHYVKKGKHETWDDMTEDVAMSILAYAGMGFEYNEMNGIVAMLENARYMSMKREVTQRTGRKLQIQHVETGKTDDDYVFDRPFTVKQAQTRIQGILDDFFQMQVYGKLQKEEGTIGRSRWSKRKVANKLNAVASYSQMAFNLQQRISNVTAGMSNVLIETAGRGVFSAADLGWAMKEYWKNVPDRLMDVGSLESDNKLSLFAERFDLHQNNGKHIDNFRKGRMARIFNTNLLFAGLNMGEDMLALQTALAIAHKHKVKYVGEDGKTHTTNLWDAYEVKYSDPANKAGAHLELKKGYTEMDGSAIDKKVEDDFARLVIGTNFRLQGIYNNDDKSSIQQYAGGALVMMYRKWIHPAIIRRYGKAGYNPLTGTEGEGYWRTFANWFGDSWFDVAQDARERKNAEAAMGLLEKVQGLWGALVFNWKNLTDYERSNMYRAMTEIGIMLATVIAIGLRSKLPPEDKEAGDARFLTWMDNMLLYQLYRARNEIGSVAPTPLIVNEITNTLGNPMAAWRPIQSMIRLPLVLMPSSWVTKVKSGPYKGQPKAYKYIMDQPILSMYKQMQHFLDPSSLINYYKADF